MSRAYKRFPVMERMDAIKQVDVLRISSTSGRHDLPHCLQTNSYACWRYEHGKI